MPRRFPILFVSLAASFATARGALADDVAPPVTITGTRTATTHPNDGPTPTEVIDRTAIEAFPNRDAAEILEGHPSLRITRTHRGAGLSIQGLDGKHVLVLVDGERIGGRRGEEIDLSRFAAGDIERIEIVRGAASALYGSDAVGGVVNIITRAPTSRPTASAELVQGTLGQTSLALRASGGVARTRLGFGATFDRQDAFNLDPSQPGTTGSAFDRLVTHLTARIDFNTKVHLDARADHTFRITSGLNALALPNDLEGRPRFRLTDHQSTLHATSFRLAPSFRFGTSELALSLAGTLTSDDLVQTRRGGLDGPSLDTSTERIVNLNGRFTSNLGTSSHLFVAGLDSFIETLESTRLSRGSAMRLRAGLYLQDEWTILEDPALVATPGIRLDLDSDYGAIVTPRIAAAITPLDGFAWRASFGLAFRGPGFRELHFAFDNPAVGYSVTGNPDLRPEHGMSFQTGFSLRVIPEVLSFRGEAFLHRLRNLITTRPLATATGAGDRFSYINIGRAASRGFELGLDFTAPLGFGGTLGYSLIDARDLATDLRLPNRALHNAELQLHWRPENLPLSASVRLSFIGERIREVPADPEPQRVPMGADMLIDARISWHPSPTTDVFVAADNLLDAGHPDALPILPRSVRVGLRGHLP